MESWSGSTLRQVVEEVERETKRLDEGMRKLHSPHRCWPSRWLTGTVVVLLAAVWMSASVISAELGRLKQSFADQLHTTVSDAVQPVVSEALAHNQEAFQHSLDEMTARLAETKQLLRVAEDVRWALTTSEIERDAQLKAEIDALKRSPRDDADMVVAPE